MDRLTRKHAVAPEISIWPSKLSLVRLKYLPELIVCIVFAFLLLLLAAVESNDLPAKL